MSNLAAQELQSFVRRIENLDDEIRGLNADKSEVFKEVKGAGFTAKTLRKVVAARRMDATERDEADTEFELYWNAVHGIELDHVRAHVENIEEFDAETGEFHEPDAQTDGAGDFERGTAQSVPAQLTDGNIVADGLSRSAEFHEPDATPAGAVVANTSGVTAGETATIATFTPKPLRPYCLNPGNSCGGQGKKHCFKCQQAHDVQQGVA